MGQIANLDQFGGENSDFGDPIKLEWGRYGRYRLPNDGPLRKVLKIATSNTSTLGQKTHTKPIKNRNLLWKKIISTIHFQLYHAFIAFHQISPPGHLGSLSLWKIQIRVLIKGHPCRWIPFMEQVLNREAKCWYTLEKLTWNPKMEVWKMICRFHVNFPGCICTEHRACGYVVTMLLTMHLQEVYL